MSNKKNPGLTRRASGLMALEPRFMFDGAAVDTAADLLAHPDATVTVGDVPSLLDVSALSTVNLAQTMAQVQAQVRNVAAHWTDAQWMDVFGIQASDTQAVSALHTLQQQILDGTYQIRVVEVDAAQMGLSMAAFAAKGPDGQPTIFLNSAWWSGAEQDANLVQALIEEVGHSFDAALHPEQDTAGDEGQLFAARVQGLELSGTELAALANESDVGVLTYNGVSYQVEHASFNFTTAYRLAPESPRYEAEKEQESDRFLGQSLGVASINDNTGLGTFSGNDVVVDLTIGGTTYHGWISRPIKDQGIVRGFYFWYDPQFTSFALASADGNHDGDSNAADNQGFVLVVDQTWFNTITSGTPIYNNGGVNTNVYEVGSSSDRVDSALNSVLVPNSVTATADALTLSEDSGAHTGNLLTNDSDPNGDSFTLTSYTISGLSGSQTLGSNVNISGVGTINISSTGAYTFTPIANYTGPVPVITYTITDAYGTTSTATFSINVTAVNDPPVATDDSVTTSENVPKVLTLNDFGTYSDPESDPLAKIQITQLATNGTLEYWDGSNWVNVTLNQELTPTQILQGQVRFTPDSNESGSNYATVQFKVSDGQVYSTSAYTLTVHVTAGNQAPVANADVNSVTEAGCGVTAVPATGNVISSGTADTDANGGTLTVTNITAYGVTQSVSSGTTSANGSSITGQYGTLTIGANGSYSYALNNSLAAIDAMNSGATKTETFTYTLSDGQGGTASTTLTLTINGTNDAPVGVDDFVSFEEGSNQSSGNYGTVTVVANGALGNDTDVDNTNGQLTVKLVDGDSVPATSTVTVATFSASSPITSVTVGATDVGGDNWSATVPTTDVSFLVSVNGGAWQTAKEVDGSDLKVRRVSGAGGGSLVFSDNVALYSYKNATFKYTEPSGANPKTAIWTVSLSNPIASSGDRVYTSSSSISNVQVGDTVSWTGSTGTITVTNVNTSTGEITLDNDSNNSTAYSVSLTDKTLTFTRAGAGISVSATQEYMVGSYGYLILNQDGAYVYTLTTDLTASEVVNDSFTYTVVDPANGCTGTATINIRVYGVDAPALVNDTLVVSEDSGGHITFNGSSGVTATDTVKTNDLNGTGGSAVTLGDVTSFKVAGDSTSYSAGTTATIAGVGTLKINANGTIVFDPIDNYVGPVPAVTYTRVDANNSSSFYTANLTITIQASDDASILAPDTKTVPEDTTAVGNVLTNDSDVDDVLTVTSYTWLDGSSTINGTLGSATNITDNGVTVGVLTLNADGSYSFVPAANWNGTVPVITYTTNTGSTSTLTITITPVSDASPVLDLDASASGTGYTTTYTVAGSAVAIGDTDTTITDSDDASMASAVIVLANPQSGDSLSVGALPTGISATTSNVGGVITVTLTGSATKADYQTAIAAIAFSSTGSSTVDRVVSVKVNDADNDSNTAYTTITVTPDNRTLTVTGTTVNETSPYVQFQVGGVTGQWVSLSLGETTNVSGNATMGTDFLPNLQYFNGSTWVNYTGGLVQIPSGNTLLVRTPVVQDLANEGAETLNLTAKNQSQVANNSVGVSGVSTIKDDGTGDVFDDNNNTSVPTFTDPGANANPNTDAKVLDDDRPLAVNSIQVNEASPFGVFTVTGAANQWTKLSLAAGTASGGGTDFGASSGTGLQYWSGSAWTTYAAGAYVKLDAGGKLLVRTPITNDVPFEGSETFFLVAQNTGGKTANGTGTILDDGTGTKYPDVNPVAGPTPVTDNTNLNDDRTLDVVGGLTFNEASTYATFTVIGQSGYVVNLVLGNGNGSTAAISGFTHDYSVDGGRNWTTYTWNGTSGNRPMIPGSNILGGSTGTIMVRVNISSESDTPYEGAEGFTLLANYATNTALSDIDTDTIIDDGTGKIDSNGDGGSDEGGAKDDDRPKVSPPPAEPPPPSPPAMPPAELAPLPPRANPPQSFASALTPLAPALVPADPPLALIDAITSGSGFQIPVSESAPPGLSLYQGITDQFVQSTNVATKVSLPFDAFVHSNKDAVIKLEAKQGDNSNLPPWVQFDPASGTFEVTPPKGFKGKLNLKVVARDDDGREAVAMFQMFIGEQQTQSRPQTRESFSDKLRMAGKRPVTLVRVSDASHQPMARDAMRTHAG